jgi:hypothetical protein
MARAIPANDRPRRRDDFSKFCNDFGQSGTTVLMCGAISPHTPLLLLVVETRPCAAALAIGGLRDSCRLGLICHPLAPRFRNPQ